MSSGTSILQSIIQAVNPKDRACYTSQSGCWRTKTTLVGTSSGLKALVRTVFVGYSTGTPVDLAASIVMVPRILGTAELHAFIRSFYPNVGGLPARINSLIREYTDVGSVVSGWKRSVPSDLTAELFSISGMNLLSIIRGWAKDDAEFFAFIRCWKRDDVLLGGVIQPYVEENLGAETTAIPPVDLSAYLKVWPYRNLKSKLYGWAESNLSAWIKDREEKQLLANVCGYRPVDLFSIIRALYSDNHIDLKETIVTQHISDINSKIKLFYWGYTTLGASLVCLPLYLLPAKISGWAERNLSAFITTDTPPGYLPTEIVASGEYRNLTNIIGGFIGINKQKDLSASISVYGKADLLASISSKWYCASLSASISPIFKDLGATIKVREIVFNEFYALNTVNSVDLRAYIGFSLCKLRTLTTGRSSLSSMLSVTRPIDIGATIEGVTNKISDSKDLGIYINYTNKYSMLSKFLSFKMSTSVSEEIRPNPTFFKDSLNLTFKIINGQTDLGISITGHIYSKSLGATIYPRLLMIYNTGTNKLLTEQLVEIDGYMEKWSEFVDVYLHAKRPIYYSDGKVFSNVYGESILSISFERISSIGVQHSYTLEESLYFESTDAAIRHGLLQVSSMSSFVNLSSSIQAIVKSSKLNVKIEGIKWEPLYLGSPFTYLKSGSLSFVGTSVNYAVCGSKTNTFGGIQDIVSTVSAVPN